MEHLESKVDHLKVIIFDLDYTLWPFWVDTHVTPPFTKIGNKIYDHDRQPIEPFDEVPRVLHTLHKLGYQLAIASRTSAIDEAEDLLRLLDWNRYFSYKQIYPGKKTRHIGRICEQSGCQPNEIIFFDDEHRNIRDLSSIDVCSILVTEGVTLDIVGHGICRFKSNHSAR